MTGVEALRAQRVRSQLLHAVVVVSVVASIASWVLAWHLETAHPGATGYTYLIEGIVATPVGVFLTWLLVARRPDLPITWVFAASLLAGSLQSLTGTFGHEALLGHGLPGGVMALAVSNIMQGLGVTATLLLLNLFPTGAPASRRWRVAVHLTLFAMATVLVSPLFGASPFGDPEHLPEFVGIAGLLHGTVSPGVLVVLEGLTGVVAVTVVATTVAHLIARFRAASGEERLQLRWFTYAVVAGVAVIVVPWHLLVEAVFGVTVPDWLAWSIGPTVVYAAMAVAVLRHRLYDIDRVVSRTVSWTVATTLLLSLYLAVVVGLQSLLRPVVGEGDLPVALATLGAAAAARPVLRRVRAVVDRRFDRARYDAARTIEEFGRSLRDEVSRDAVVDGLRRTAITTVGPSSVGIVLPPQRTTAASRNGSGTPATYTSAVPTGGPGR